jgi:alpha-acetolactate decarboxylase
MTSGTIVQYGKMHEAIGRKQHQGRVTLRQLVEQPHFFGVAALEQLAGEATVYDGKITVTRVDAQGRLLSTDRPAAEAQATLLVGAYVSSWTDHNVTAPVPPEALDQYIAETAARSGVKTSEPFVFTAEGEFSKLRLHVIHGACPMHARLNKIELPKEQRPYELEVEKVRGTIVGVYAKDAVGNITHPGTSTHVHLVYKDAQSGQTVTGHVERIGLVAGAVLRVPQVK